MRITQNFWNSRQRAWNPHVDLAGDGRVLMAAQNPFVNTRLFASFIKAARWNLRRTFHSASESHSHAWRRRPGC